MPRLALGAGAGVAPAVPLRRVQCATLVARAATTSATHTASARGSGWMEQGIDAAVKHGMAAPRMPVHLRRGGRRSRRPRAHLSSPCSGVALPPLPSPPPSSPAGGHGRWTPPRRDHSLTGVDGI